MGRIKLTVMTVLVYFLCSSHVGSPNIIFEGSAGEYKILVNIQPPQVVPGIAFISVKVFDEHISSVEVQSIYYRWGSESAAQPEAAKQDKGDPMYYNGELWLMSHGSSSVKVIVDGLNGPGSTVIPVPAIATAQIGMETGLKIPLIILGLILLIGGATIVASSAGEGVLSPGKKLDKKQKWKTVAIGAFSACLLAAILHFGWKWWLSEENNYENRYLYRPVGLETELTQVGERNKLRLKLEDEGHFDRKPGDLVPDHGKFMHLFLISEAQADAFAHLHPIKVDSVTYDVLLPEMPAGKYRVFADIVHSSGLNETLVTSFQNPGKTLQAGINAPGETPIQPVDEDDTWYSYQKPKENKQLLESGHTITWEGPSSQPIRAGKVTSLKFSVEGPNGLPAIIEPYLGMLGHAVVMRDDASVFIHLHPIGTISMAAQEAIAQKISGDITLCLPLDSLGYDLDKIGQLDKGEMTTMKADILKMMKDKGLSNEVSFPYAFPKPGEYRVWAQLKVDGQAQTAAFDVTVEE